MALTYSPKISSDGLVLALDAANKKSYPGSGTLWNDMSSNGFVGTLTNGPTFSQSNFGFINFDGSNDYVENIGTVSSFSFIQNTGVYTISAWAKPSSLGSQKFLMGNNVVSGYYSRGFSVIANSINGLGLNIYGAGNTILIKYADSYFTDTNWVNIACVGNGTSCQFYKNGSAFGSSSNLFGALSSGDSSNNLAVGRTNNYNASYWSGGISTVLIYNRVLTAAEINRNFNAMRRRFGV